MISSSISPTILLFTFAICNLQLQSQSSMQIYTYILLLYVHTCHTQAHEEDIYYAASAHMSAWVFLTLAAFVSFPIIIFSLCCFTRRVA